MVSTDHFRQELIAQFGRATHAGRIDVLINSAELGRSIRGGSGSTSCCDAMQAEFKPGDTLLLDRSNGAGMTVRYLLPRIEEFCQLRQFQRVRNFAIHATEFTAAGFDRQETHGLAAPRARRGRGIFSHWPLSGSGGSATLAVTDRSQRRGGDETLCSL